MESACSGVKHMRMSWFTWYASCIATMSAPLPMMNDAEAFVESGYTPLWALKLYTLYVSRVSMPSCPGVGGWLLNMLSGQ